VIELGPGAGDAGGRIVAQGTPEDLARVAQSPTGRYLQDLLSDGPTVQPADRPT
jgi:excinuclease ABC subunit A